jgi:hypothetical protein
MPRLNDRKLLELSNNECLLSVTESESETHCQLHCCYSGNASRDKRFWQVWRSRRIKPIIRPATHTSFLSAFEKLKFSYC